MDRLLGRTPPENSIAVVGREYLLPSDVTERLSEMGLDSEDQVLRAQVVNQWVDRQLLLHEAHRRGLHRDKALEEKLEEIRDELLIQRLYDEAVRVEAPSDEDVVEYWRNHTGEFTRMTDEVELIIAYAPTRSQAWGVRNGLDRSDTDLDLLENYPEIHFDTTTAMSVERLPRRLVRAIEPLKNGQASLPFQLNDQWLVVRMMERHEAGRPKPLEDMLPALRARLVTEERTRREYSFTANLRQEARREGTVMINIPSNMLLNRPGATPGSTADSASATSTTTDETEE